MERNHTLAVRCNLAISWTNSRVFLWLATAFLHIQHSDVTWASCRIKPPLDCRSRVAVWYGMTLMFTVFTGESSGGFDAKRAGDAETTVLSLTWESPHLERRSLYWDGVHFFATCRNVPIVFRWISWHIHDYVPDSKDHGANMAPIQVLSAPGGPHVGPINLAIRDDEVTDDRLEQSVWYLPQPIYNTTQQKLRIYIPTHFPTNHTSWTILAFVYDHICYVWMSRCLPLLFHLVCTVTGDRWHVPTSEDIYIYIYI